MSTADVCRAPSAQQLFRVSVAGEPLLAGVTAVSAGTAVEAGAVGCPVAPALAGYARDHRSRALTAELVAAADLVLPASREQVAAVVGLVPAARSRTFTMRQAGRIADWLVSRGAVATAAERRRANGSWRGRRFGRGRDVVALPDSVEDRWAWLVSQMDAARAATPVAEDAASAGSAASPAGSAGGAEPVAAGAERRSRGDGRAQPGRHRRTGTPADAGTIAWGGAASGGTASGGTGWGGARSGATSSGSGLSDLGDGDVIDLTRGSTHPDDVPDAHTLGTALHPLAFDHVKAATQSLVRLLRETAARHLSDPLPLS